MYYLSKLKFQKNKLVFLDHKEVTYPPPLLTKNLEFLCTINLLLFEASFLLIAKKGQKLYRLSLFMDTLAACLRIREND